jgi:hypothetical protein
VDDEVLRGELDDPGDACRDLVGAGRRRGLRGLGLRRHAVEGAVALGATITVRSKAAPGRAFPVKVTEFAPGQRMVWSGGMPLGLFKGVRTFTLTPEGNGSTRFTVREEYTGPLLGLMWRSMPDLGPSFSRFANGLKARVEGGAS